MSTREFKTYKVSLIVRNKIVYKGIKEASSPCKAVELILHDDPRIFIPKGERATAQVTTDVGIRFDFLLVGVEKGPVAYADHL